MSTSSESLEISNVQKAEKPNANRPETGDKPPATEKPTRERKLTFAELFKQAESAEAPASDTDSSTERKSDDNDAATSGEKPGKLDTVDSIDALTKKLGLKPEQVYAIKVPMRDGAEALTIGQLKDKVAEVGDFDARELKFEQRRVAAEGELIKAQTELRDLMALIPREHLTPELVNKVRKTHSATAERERRLTLQFIPEWKNEAAAEKDITGMVEFLSKWGFDDHFITTVIDHRAMKFIRDMYLRDVRLEKALGEVKHEETKSLAPSNRGGRSPRPVSNEGRAGASDQRSRMLGIMNR